MQVFGDLLLFEELLPLFDSTRNDFARQRLRQLFAQPLNHREEILERQQILKGFMQQPALLESYAYARFDLQEVHGFLARISDENAVPDNLLEWQFLNRTARQLLISRYTQTVFLFHKLYRYFFREINSAAFPENYQQELKQIRSFLASLPLTDQEALLRKRKAGYRQTTVFLKLLATKNREGLLADFWEKLFQFEALLSVAKGILQHQFVFPEITAQECRFEALVHPLMAGPVANDFHRRHPVVVLSGPNMSGKSTFLKAFALAVYLAHLGFAVPAKSAFIPVFDALFVFVQHRDSLSEGYSHFMQEIQQLKLVVEAARAGQKCLAVFDELFRGTNEADALAVNEMTLKGLVRFEHSLFFISTHLQGLKQLLLAGDGRMAAYCFGCQLKDGLPLFDYTLQRGWSEVKVGQLLYKKEGLPGLLGSPD